MSKAREGLETVLILVFQNAHQDEAVELELENLVTEEATSGGEPERSLSP